MLKKEILWIIIWVVVNPLVCFSQITDMTGFELNGEEAAFLKAHPVIRIGIMADWPPLDFVDEFGNPAGIGAGYIRLLNQRLTGVLTIVPGPFKENFEQVKNRQLDGLMDITPKEDREPFFHFTRPYLKIPHVIVGRKNGPQFKSEEELGDRTLALERGFFNIKYFRKNYPMVRIREYHSTRAALGAVSQGEADAYVGNRAVAVYLIEQELMGNLQIQGRVKKPPVLLSIGIRKDWPELAAILDKALASLTVEEKRQIRSHWVETLTPQTGPEQTGVLSPEQITYILKSIAVVFIIMTAFIFIFWIVRGRPRHFSIRGTLLGVLFVFTGLTISIGVFAMSLLSYEKRLARAETRRNQYADLAYELKQSSDDLTRFARTFVVTGNAKYESYFQDILDIRDGIIPHPVNNTPAFWDHVAAGTLEPEYRGDRYSIEQRMAELGLSEEEKKELSLAKQESDDLTKLEAVAMNAVKGLFDDGQGNFTVVKKPEREMALNLLHGERYHLAKNKIMKHIDNFLILIKDRIEREVSQTQEKVTAILLTITALTFCTVSFGFVSFFLLKRKIIVPLGLLKSGARRLENEDYSQAIKIDSQDEAGDLANAFNAMAQSIKDRTTRLRSVIDTAVDAIVVVSSKGIVETFSPAAEKIFGYGAAEIIGKNVSVLMPEDIAAEHDGQIHRYLETNERHIIGKRIETTGRKKDGKIFPVSIAISRADVGQKTFFTGIIRDITKRKEAERELKESEALHRLLAECSADMIVQYDLEGTVMYVSPACRDLIGFEPEGLVGRPVLDFFLAEYYEDVKSGMETLINNPGKVTLNARMKQYDGSSRWVDMVCQPIVDSETGRTKAMLGVARDITEQKLLEDARRFSLALNEMADESSLDQILEYGLEEGIFLTESVIGYIHFVDQENRTIELRTWSAKIRSEYGIAKEPIHYPIDGSALWEECIRTRKPVINNQFGAALPCGLGKDCIPVARHMAAPILEDNDVVAIVGVGNKSRDYLPYDVDILSLLGENIWSIVCRKKNAAAIIQNEERLKLVLKGGNLGFWDINLKIRSTIVNEIWAQIFGYRLEEVSNAYKLWKSSIHKNDRPLVLETIEDYLAGKTPVYKVEYRIITRDKQTRWVVSRGATVEWDNDKTPLRMAGTLLDITEHKNIEKEFRQNMEDLQRFSDIAIGREERMIDLKQEVNQLLGRTGQENKYKIR